MWANPIKEMTNTELLCASKITPELSWEFGLRWNDLEFVFNQYTGEWCISERGKQMDKKRSGVLVSANANVGIRSEGDLSTKYVEVALPPDTPVGTPVTVIVLPKEGE